MTASAAAQPLRNTQTTPSLSTKPAFRCGVCKQVWNVGSMMPHNGIHCGKELEDLADIPHPASCRSSSTAEIAAAEIATAEIAVAQMPYWPAASEAQWPQGHGEPAAPVPAVTTEDLAALPLLQKAEQAAQIPDDAAAATEHNKDTSNLPVERSHLLHSECIPR